VSHCPTCGQPIADTSAEAARLLARLSHDSPHREVYRAQDGRWYLTYGGGPFSDGAVTLLRERGQIQSVYSSLPDDAFHIGRTWDCERTLAARRKLGKAAPDYYLGDPPDRH
jgi:hypothetical protein